MRLLPTPSHSTLAFLVASTCLVYTASAANGQEWTRFRGPNGQGQSESVFDAKFTPSDFAWKANLPGEGASSPVLWGEKLFLLASDRKNATRYLVCLNAKTGKELWTNDYESQTHKLHSRSSYSSSTPAVDSERLYVAWSTHETTTFMALDHDGKEIWKKDLGRWIGSHGFGTSPMIYKDMVILHNSLQAGGLDPGEKPGDSFMLALDRRTGDEIWRSPRPGARVCYSVPAIYKPANGGPDQLICCSTEEGVYSLNPLNGKLNWKTAGAIRMRSVSSPVIAGGLILGSTGSGGGGNYVVAVRPGTQPEVAYEIKRNAPYVPTSVVYKGLVFLFGDKGIASCADVETGEVQWVERMSTGFSGSPIRAGDKIYTITDDGELLCVAGTKDFKLLGKTDLEEPSRSTPAVHDGRMYLRTKSHLICVEQSAS
jgi:outer membrane protein assembly factor BamB